jgi:hypothetical protein
MRHINWPVQLTKNVSNFPLARDYIFDAERNSTTKDSPVLGLTEVGRDRQRELSCRRREVPFTILMVHAEGLNGNISLGLSRV